MDLHIDLGDGVQLTSRIYTGVLEAVLDGRLRPGERLPSTRRLAGQLGVARSTVVGAYDRLTAEGFLTSNVGAGTFVGSQQLPPARPRSAPAGAVVPRPQWRSIVPIATATPVDVEFDFAIGVPDGQLFPLETWRRLVARELRSPSMRSGQYAPPEGSPGAREAIARHIGVSRSVRADPDDVIVTNGAQQALDLVGRVLIEPGACVAVEEPGYPPARRLFESLGANVVGIPVDGDGLDVAALPASARLVYVTPSHQFPLGVPMSLARRSELLCWARDHDAVVVEDDYDSEFRFEDRPLEPLQHIDPDGRVIYVGSFSKTMLPSLRLGFLVAPASLRPALRAAKALTDNHGDPVTQRALARFIDTGELARHVRRATRVYRLRRDAIITVVAERFSDRLEVVPSCAGLHVAARSRSGSSTDLTRVVARARAAGIHVESLADYCATSSPVAGLLIGYGAITGARIDHGLRGLAGCFAELEGSG